MGHLARVAVIGVGNEFRRDDGVGWAVIRRLRDGAVRRPLPPGTVLSVSDGEPARLIGLWEGTALTVVVDAVRAGRGHPGKVHRLAAWDAELHGAGAVTSHGLGFGEAVELARALGRLPRHLCVYAVEAADTSLGTGLTPAVEAAVRPLAARVEHEIRRHHEATTARQSAASPPSPPPPPEPPRPPAHLSPPHPFSPPDAPPPGPPPTADPPPPGPPPAPGPTTPSARLAPLSHLPQPPPSPAGPSLTPGSPAARSAVSGASRPGGERR